MTNWPALNTTLKWIEVTPSTNEKKNILCRVDNPDLLEDLKIIFQLAYDPYIKFYNTKVYLPKPSNEKLKLHDPRFYKMDDLLGDLEDLSERRITGDSAKTKVREIYYSLPEEFRPWLEKILQKDLKIGCAAGLINSVWKDLITEFKLPLCERFKKIKNIEYPIIIEPKIDGVRSLAFIEDFEVKIYARSGIKFDNFKVIEKELAGLDLNGFVLDGEIQDENFQNTMNNARRLYDVQSDNAIFKVWDIIAISCFQEQDPGVNTLLDRKYKLDELVKDRVPHVKVLPYQMANNEKEMLELYDFWKNVMGEEGIIGKDPKSLYFYKRHKNWFKVKKNDVESTQEEYTATITGIYSGEFGTKYFGCLGGFSAKFVHPIDGNVIDGELIEVNFSVGTGFTDQQRIDFWNRKEELLGKLIDCEAQEITTNKNGLLSLRFPVFKRFREDL